MELVKNREDGGVEIIEEKKCQILQLTKEKQAILVLIEGGGNA